MTLEESQELSRAWADADHLRDVLRSLEWSGETIVDYGGVTAPCCPACGGVKPGEDTYGNGNRIDHEEECRLVTALAPRSTSAKP